MNELEERLNAVLSDPGELERLTKMAGRLLGGGSAEAPEAETPPAEPLPAGLTGDFALHLCEYALTDSDLVPAGTLLGEDEAGCQRYEAPVLPRAAGEIRVTETERAPP